MNEVAPYLNVDKVMHFPGARYVVLFDVTSFYHFNIILSLFFITLLFMT